MRGPWNLRESLGVHLAFPPVLRDFHGIMVLAHWTHIERLLWDFHGSSIETPPMEVLWYSMTVPMHPMGLP